jgi:hypothetical protein
MSSLRKIKINSLQPMKNTNLVELAYVVYILLDYHIMFLLFVLTLSCYLYLNIKQLWSIKALGTALTNRSQPESKDDECWGTTITLQLIYVAYSYC